MDKQIDGWPNMTKVPLRAKFTAGFDGHFFAFNTFPLALALSELCSEVECKMQLQAKLREFV